MFCRTQCFFPELPHVRTGLYAALRVAGFVAAMLATQTSGLAAPKTRGFVPKTYIDSQGVEHKYLVFVPYDYQPGEKRPLLLFLNGKGENGIDGVSSVSNNFGVAIWEMKRTFPFVAAIPQCRPVHTWNGEELQRALAILDRVAADYGTDPDRVYVTGVSAGGTGVWNVINADPWRFAAAVPVCGNSAVNAPSLAEANLPIWNFYNAGDAAPLVESNRRGRQALLEAGASPLVTEYPQSGHNAWDLAYRSSGMYQWLLEQSLTRNAQQRRLYRLWPPDEMLSRWTRMGDSKWVIGNDGSIACDNADRRPEYLIAPAAHASIEFHVDVFPDATDDGCQLGFIAAGNDGSGLEYTLHVCFAEAGSGGLIHRKSGWITALEPAAQRQLQRGVWNDVRLHFDGGRISARINGWQAIDVAVPLARGPFRVALVSRDTALNVRWRNARMYALD